MNLQPLADRVIIEPIENEAKTPSGLYLPENSKKKPTRGRIVAVGPGMVTDTGGLRPVRVNAGQIVIFEAFSGTEVKYKEQTYIILREHEIMAVENQE